MDFLAHLVDAPLANILISAGLAFLGIAIVGKVSGKIEPSNSGRLMSGVLGLVLLAYGIYAHSAVDREQTQARTASKEPAAGSQYQPTRKPAERSSTSALSGKWKNDNSQTRGITRLEVRQNGALVQVHAWGACSPQDCDWGTERGAIIGDSASVAWDQGFVLRKMTLTPDARRLRMVLDSVYRDNRAPQHGLEYFVKSE